MNKNILVVEQNPVLCDRFRSAFLLSGYHVQATGNITEAVDMVNGRNRYDHPFDLVVVDVSDGRYRGFVADVLSANAQLPVFMLKDAADKSLIIDLLNQKRVEFIEQYIESHAKIRREPSRQHGGISL